MRPNLPFLLATSNALLKPGRSAEVEDAVSVFAAAHRSDEDRQAYISASRRTSSVIAKAKAEAWQTTCSSLSPRSNPKSVHSLLRSVAGFPLSSSSSANLPNCSSPRESASVYAAYLRSHFSVSQPKALHSRARGYLTKLRRAMCPVDSHSSFCSPFSPRWFPFISATNFTKLERLHRATSRTITGCLSSSPIFLFLSEASLPPLRATLTHFTLSSYKGLFVSQPPFLFQV